MSTVQLEIPTNFPSAYHDCYEATLMNICMYMGLLDELPLMSMHAYFLFIQDDVSVFPRCQTLKSEWERNHGLRIQSSQVADTFDMQKQLRDNLDSGTPVCLPLDIYFLPHTSHYHHLHTVHYLAIFGYSNDQYYIISPYYRYRGWINANAIYESFFSPINFYRSLISVSRLRPKVGSDEQVLGLIRESCQYMLGFATPTEWHNYTGPKALGLAGILSLSTFIKQLPTLQDEDIETGLLELSAQIISIGNSRYWFRQMLQSCQLSFLSPETAAYLDKLFSAVIPAWRAAGTRFGAAIHEGNKKVIEQTGDRIKSIYEQEQLLFNTLLGALPDYEAGSL